MDGNIVIGVELETAGFARALQELRERAASAGTGMLGGLVTALQRVQNGFQISAAAASGWGSRLTGLFSRVRAGAAALAPSLLTLGRTAGGQLLAGLTSVNALGAGQTLNLRVIGGFNRGTFRETGLAAAQRLLAGLRSGQGDLQSAAAAMAGSVRGSFSAGGWSSVGYQISAGVASGIRSGGGLIRSAAVSAAYSALAAAKSALGIHSPSRVFQEQVGRMIPAGISEGIRREDGALRQTVQQQSRAWVRSARSQVTARVAGERSLPLPAAGMPGNMELRLEAPVYIDGRELARATAKYTGQQLLWEAM